MAESPETYHAAGLRRGTATQLLRGSGHAPEQLWADYEEQVLATDVAWRTYEKASEIADVLFAQYQAAARVRGEAYMAWQQVNKTRNRVYDAYWATYDRVA